VISRPAQGPVDSPTIGKGTAVRRTFEQRAVVRRTIGKGTLSRWVAVGAAGTVLVAGCAQARLGAAALYGNQRISATRLAAEVANLNAAYQADKRIQLTYPAADTSRKVLGWMLEFATYERIATRLGIKITPAAAQRQLNLLSQSERQAGATLTEAAVAHGVPPDMVGELGRFFAIQFRLANRLDHGVAPTTPTAQAVLLLAINHQQCLAAKSLDIAVNPQYGAFDYLSLGVVPLASTLAAGPGGSASSPAFATQPPQLTPHC